MDDLDRDFENMKKNCILEMTKRAFEEGSTEYVKSGNWNTMEELDEWFDKNLRDYMETRHNINQYFDAKIYS